MSRTPYGKGDFIWDGRCYQWVNDIDRYIAFGPRAGEVGGLVRRGPSGEPIGYPGLRGNRAKWVNILGYRNK